MSYEERSFILLRCNTQQAARTSFGCRSAGEFGGYCASLLDFTGGRLCCNDALPPNDREGWNENFMS